MAELENLLKNSLSFKTVDDVGSSGGGCICNSRIFQTEDGKIFVKTYEHDKGDVMFRGEFASLEAIKNTNTVRVPNPIKIIEDEGKLQSVLVMEHIEMRSLSKYQAKLGEELARLHLHNRKMLELKIERESNITNKTEHLEAVNGFGFHENTCCGSIPQDNSWSKNWIV